MGVTIVYNVYKMAADTGIVWAGFVRRAVECLYGCGYFSLHWYLLAGLGVVTILVFHTVHSI